MSRFFVTVPAEAPQGVDIMRIAQRLYAIILRHRQRQFYRAVVGLLLHYDERIELRRAMRCEVHLRRMAAAWGISKAEAERIRLNVADYRLWLKSMSRRRLEGVIE